jgi:amidohydrolase
MTTDELKETVSAEIDRLAGMLIALSHDIHAHPELNYEEHHAHDALTAALDDAGLRPTRHAHGLATAFRADCGRAGAPTVAVLCEYDALPDIGHACGHNVIAAAGLGAGIALAAVADAAGGRVSIIGTPAEEGGGGKVALAEQGAFADVDVAMMVHGADCDLTEIEAIAIETLEITYHGKASHAAAAPHLGRNALDAAVLGYLGVGALRQHILPTERVHGIFTNGGGMPNIVPQEAATRWFVRSPTAASLAPLKGRVLTALQAGAAATGCTCTHTWAPRPYSDLRTNAPLTASYQANAARLGRTVGDPRQLGKSVVGSTDMGNVSYLVPSIHPMIQVAPEGVAIHTQDFARWAVSPMGDKAVLDGAKAMAMTAIDYWTDESLRSAVTAAFGQIATS